MEQLTLKQARPEDRAVVVDFVGRYYAYDHIPFDRTDIEASLAVLLADPGLGFVWLIEREARPVGYAVATFGFDHEVGGRIAILTDYFLGEEARGQGWGKLVLREIEQRCRAAGARAIELQVEHGNPRARALYEKAGFKAFERAVMYKRLGYPEP